MIPTGNHSGLGRLEHHSTVTRTTRMLKPPLAQSYRLAHFPSELPIGIAGDEVRLGLKHCYECVGVEFAWDPFKHSAFATIVADHRMLLIHQREDGCVVNNLSSPGEALRMIDLTRHLGEYATEGRLCHHQFPRPFRSRLRHDLWLHRRTQKVLLRLLDLALDHDR